MKSTTAALAVLLLVMAVPAFAEDGLSAEAGVTPDSPLYGLDKAMDSLSLALTFGNENKAAKGIEIAQERLQEARVMAESDKAEHAELAREEHRKAIEGAEKELGKIEEDNDAVKSREAMEKVARIQEKIESHYQKVSEVKDAILERMRERKTPEQYAKMEQVFSEIKEKALEMDGKASEKKESVKSKYRQSSGKTDAEVEAEEEAIDEKTGLAQGREERARKEISNAETALVKARQKLQEEKDKGSNVTEFEQEVEEIEKQIDAARQAKDKGNAKDARDIAEKIKDFGNEVSAIATRLGDARREGNFEQVKAELRSEIEQRHIDNMREILQKAPDESMQNIIDTIEDAENRQQGDTQKQEDNSDRVPGNARE